MTTATACTVNYYDTHYRIYSMLEVFDSVGHPLPNKRDKFFQDGAYRWLHTPENNRCNSGLIKYVMSVRDAKALRNRAHRALRAFIKEHGNGDWEEAEFLMRLRDRLDESLAKLP